MTKPLKIAIQIFGHLRTFRDCAPYLYENLLNKYDCDVFMHTWSKLNHNSQTWHGNSDQSDILTNEFEVKKIYPNIKRLKIEEQVPCDLGNAIFIPNFDSVPTKISIFGMGSMIYSMAQANKLREEYEKENGLEYDFVICVRPDIWLKKDVDLIQLLSTQSPDDVDNGYFAFANLFAKVVRGFQSFGVTDALFFARPKVISRVFRNLPDINKIFQPNTTYSHGPEYEMIKVIQNLGFVTYRVDFKYGEDWEILRTKLNIYKTGKVRFLLRKRMILLWIFPTSISPIFNFKFRIFVGPLKFFIVDFSIGNPQRDVLYA